MSSDGILRVRVRLGPRHEAGYNLVALMVILVVINIAVAAAMPMWGTVVRRDREAELLARGWQYAEAIRVFQARFGRYPIRLEELIEVEPRCIRQLWTDPLSETGAWEPILAGSGQAIPGTQGQGPQGQGAPGRDLTRPRPPGRPTIQAQAGESPSEVTAFDRPTVGTPGAEGQQIGPIEGVRPTATGTALKSFLGRTEYREWEFRAAMLAGPSVSLQGGTSLPRIGVESLSRPLPSMMPGMSGSTSGGPTGTAPRDRTRTRPTPDSGDEDDG